MQSAVANVRAKTNMSLHRKYNFATVANAFRFYRVLKRDAVRTRPLLMHMCT